MLTAFFRNLCCRTMELLHRVVAALCTEKVDGVLWTSFLTIQAAACSSIQTVPLVVTRTATTAAKAAWQSRPPQQGGALLGARHDSPMLYMMT